MMSTAAEAKHSKVRQRVLMVRRLALTAAVLLPALLSAQDERSTAREFPLLNAYYEQTYLAGAYNFAFDREFPRASHLFNAFDYGHAILYERLWHSPGTAARELEGKDYDYLVTNLLVRPPRLPVDEAAIGPTWSLLAPEVLEMFEWAHQLHRQMYDVIVHNANDEPERDAQMAELLRYYQSRPALAFSSTPKSMTLMEGQNYSLAFRRQDPKFNGLIWSYHWLQMTLYDALLAGATASDRTANVDAVVGRFYEMIRAGGNAPSTMPMTPAIAPVFTARYPEAAAIFDNLHSLHDVVSDILANPNVPRDQKRLEILKAASRYRDARTSTTSVSDWISMANQMGVGAMGGAPPLPRRTAPGMRK